LLKTTYGNDTVIENIYDKLDRIVQIFTGQFWKEPKDAFTPKIQQDRGYFIVAAGISQVDTPAPGPADAVSVI